MSIRTIIEINHDCLHKLENLSHDDLLRLIRRATDCNRELNAAPIDCGVKHSYGVTTLATRHHLDRLRVRVVHTTVFDDGLVEFREIEGKGNG